jgi:hypothetical protein
MADQLTPADVMKEVSVHTDATEQALQHLPPSEDRETARKRNETVRALTERIVDEGEPS